MAAAMLEAAFNSPATKTQVPQVTFPALKTITMI